MLHLAMVGTPTFRGLTYPIQHKIFLNVEFLDNDTLLPIWSAYQYESALQAPVLYATDASTFWKLSLDLVDFNIGRPFWAGQKLILRPYIGLRFANVDQNFNITLKGGSWENQGNPSDTYKDETQLQNDFRAIGVKSGLDSSWIVACGWGLYGKLGASILYGRFNIDHQEDIHLLTTPFTKTSICKIKDTITSSRAIIDTGLGARWSGLICDCRYGLSFSFGWEQSLFLHQNQLWRISRLGGENQEPPLNLTGTNIFSQSRGSLSISGLILEGTLNF